MEFLNSWLQGIIISVVIATIIELILPNGNTKKYIKLVLGVYVVFNIITPVVNKISNNNFELSSILKIDEYTKKLETYEVSSKNIDISKANENNIKQIYLSNLKKDVKEKTEQQGYVVKNIQIEVEEDENYTIKSIVLSVEKNKDDEELQEENKINETNNKVIINKIETVNIDNIEIGDNKNLEEDKKENKNSKESNITQKERKELRKYLALEYKTKENIIEIY